SASTPAINCKLVGRAIAPTLAADGIEIVAGRVAAERGVAAAGCELARRTTHRDADLRRSRRYRRLHRRTAARGRCTCHLHMATLGERSRHRLRGNRSERAIAPV